jgi:hypothetical protein
MASLYRKPLWKTDPAGAKTKEFSKKWWGQFRDANGRLRRHPLATDKRAAQAMLNDLVRKVELQTAGLSHPCEEHAKRPLREHLDDFERHYNNRDTGTKHVAETIAKIKKIAVALRCARFDGHSNCLIL